VRWKILQKVHGKFPWQSNKKNFENRFIFAEVMIKIPCLVFFGDTLNTQDIGSEILPSLVLAMPLTVPSTPLSVSA